MRFVLDNSVSARWLFRDGTEEDLAYAAHALELLQREQGSMVIVPGLWALELANVIARAEARGWLKEAQSAEFLGLVRAMAIEEDAAPGRQALGDTLHLARRHGLSAYDAAYLELALREGIPLATLDTKLRKALEDAGGVLA